MPSEGTKMVKQVEAKATATKDKMVNTSIRYPFWFGGSASCIAAMVTHPLDLGK